MKTIIVQLSDLEHNSLGLSKNSFLFSEIIDLIEQQIARQDLHRSVELATQNGLSSMTMEEINAEIKSAAKTKHHLSELRGLGKEMWQNLSIDSFVQCERALWD